MDETPISRGFKPKRREQNSDNRVPPGQHVTADFRILSAGPTPQIRMADWTLALFTGREAVSMGELHQPREPFVEATPEGTAKP